MVAFEMKILCSAVYLSLKVEGGRAFILTGLILVLQVLLILPAFLTGWILDGLVERDFASSRQHLLYFFILVLVILGLSPLKAWVAAAFAQRATKEQSLRWTKSMLQQPLAKLTSQGVGKMHIAIERASLSFEGVVTFLFGQWIPSIVEVIVVFCALILVLGLTPASICLAFGLAYFGLTYFLQSWKRDFVARVNDAEDELAEGFVNVFSKVRTIKAYRALKSAQALMNKVFSIYAIHAERLGLVSGTIVSAQGAYLSLGMFGILAFGFFAFQQELSWFTAGSFLIAVTLFGMLSTSLGRLAEVLAHALEFEEDLRTLNKLLTSTSTKNYIEISTFKAGRANIFKEGEILELDNITILVRDDLSLNPGDRILITGDSGSGKSAILTEVSDRLSQDLCVYEVQEPEFIENSSELGVSHLSPELLEALNLPRKTTLDLSEGSGGEKTLWDCKSTF